MGGACTQNIWQVNVKKRDNLEGQGEDKIILETNFKVTGCEVVNWIKLSLVNL